MSQSSAPTTCSQQSTPSTPLSRSDGKILLGNGNVNLAHMHARLHYSPHPFVWRHHHSQPPRSLSTSHGQNQLNLSAAKKDDFPTLSSIAVFFVRRPRSACHVERTFSLMGHIQTKDRLHMGNNSLRHLAMMYVNKPSLRGRGGGGDCVAVRLLWWFGVGCARTLSRCREQPLACALLPNTPSLPLPPSPLPPLLMPLPGKRGPHAAQSVANGIIRPILTSATKYIEKLILKMHKEDFNKPDLNRTSAYVSDVENRLQAIKHKVRPSASPSMEAGRTVQW